jgi:Xaa-Pro aminopeptidase
MTTKASDLDIEKVGDHFSEGTLVSAQRKAWKVLAKMAELIQPGLTEEEISALAKELFQKAGAEKHWHRPLVRVGRNTLLTFSDVSEPNLKVGEKDILFLDFGPVFDGHEADIGATIVFGDDPEMERIANSASALFGEVAKEFKEKNLTGKQLYAFAEERAKAMNVVFVAKVDGHRVSDFPHAIYSKTGLGEFEQVPTPKRWILEIQIRHPHLPYGAFYEDLL